MKNRWIENKLFLIKKKKGKKLLLTSTNERYLLKWGLGLSLSRWELTINSRILRISWMRVIAMWHEWLAQLCDVIGTLVNIGTPFLHIVDNGLAHLVMRIHAHHVVLGYWPLGARIRHERHEYDHADDGAQENDGPGLVAHEHRSALAGLGVAHGTVPAFAAHTLVARGLVHVPAAIECPDTL
jgi:hypothetical protein